VASSLDPSLFREAKIVVDIREQCTTVGELHHALKLKVIELYKKIIELGHVVSGRDRVRENAKDIIIFDSKGTAMQDTALALLAYEKAIQNTGRHYFQFFLRNTL
jgi:alanine dehydrogenase